MNIPERQTISGPASGGNPYAPPKACPLAAAEGSGSPAHATFRLVAWIFWALLVLSFMWDLSGRLFRDVAGPNPSGTDNLLPLLLVAAVQSAMVVFMRWIVFTYMTRKMNPAGVTRRATLEKSSPTLEKVAVLG